MKKNKKNIIILSVIAVVLILIIIALKYNYIISNSCSINFDYYSPYCN